MSSLESSWLTNVSCAKWSVNVQSTFRNLSSTSPTTARTTTRISSRTLDARSCTSDSICWDHFFMQLWCSVRISIYVCGKHTAWERWLQPNSIEWKMHTLKSLIPPIITCNCGSLSRGFPARMDSLILRNFSEKAGGIEASSFVFSSSVWIDSFQPLPRQGKI